MAKGPSISGGFWSRFSSVTEVIMIKQDQQDPCHLVQRRRVFAMTCGRVRGVLTPVSLVTVSEM